MKNVEVRGRWSVKNPRRWADALPDNSPHDHPDYGVVSAIGMFQQQPFRDSAKSTAVIDLPPFQS
jgi:hypothetical protein